MSLNHIQKSAAEHVEGPLLILAGAGSGKTRVITHRIAYLIENGFALPGEIFSVTFTNKAAREMKERVELLLRQKGIPSRGILIATFHGAGAKILREYGHLVGLARDFVIFDQSDQKALVKSLLADFNISDKLISPKFVIQKISSLKNKAIDPLVYEPEKFHYHDKKILPVLKEYQRALARYDAIDFGDLLFKTYQLFAQNKDVCEQFQDRYRFIQVDEYQDTNFVQFEFLKLISSKYKNLCVVGDEDQSIYKWRGADVSHIINFEKHYSQVKLVKLEQNYRSTGHIIRAASELISHNKTRYAKKLFTEQEDGDLVSVVFTDSDHKEAKYVVGQISSLIQKNESLADMAIFYRTHAQSRMLEDYLRHYAINYKIFGGLKFYDRAEIKDIVCYLRLMVNPKDDVSLLRILNVPARGIGKKTKDIVSEFSKIRQSSCLNAINFLVNESEDVSASVKKKLKLFLSLYDELLQMYQEEGPLNFYKFLLDKSGYKKLLEKNNNVESLAKLDNLQEFASAIGDFESRQENATLSEFLEEVSLVDQLDSGKEDEIERPCVTLMTLHSSKGLEFPFVFMVGLEEELFPSIRINDGGDSMEDQVEEERRLCYVGMTRAQKKLVMTSAELRRIYGKSQYRRPSRFLENLPQDEIDFVNLCESASESATTFSSPSQTYSSPFGQKSKAKSFFDDQHFGDSGDEFGGAFDQDSYNDSPYNRGQKIKHPKYGIGTIQKVEGRGDNVKLEIKFSVGKNRKFMAKFAPLQIMA